MLCLYDFQQINTNELSHFETKSSGSYLFLLFSRQSNKKEAVSNGS
jgi:hypothetical protein